MRKALPVAPVQRVVRQRCQGKRSPDVSVEALSDFRDLQQQVYQSRRIVRFVSRIRRPRIYKRNAPLCAADLEIDRFRNTRVYFDYKLGIHILVRGQVKLVHRGFESFQVTLVKLRTPQSVTAENS